MIILIQVFVTVQIPGQKSEPDSTAAEQPRWTPPAASPLQPVCPACGWTKPYSNLRSARNALAAHKQHCPRAERRLSEFARPVRAARS
jgi:hypothetical protein